MKTIRAFLLSLIFLIPVGASAEVSLGIGIGTPNLHIGITLGTFPILAPIPGYPVYYAPNLAFNYFFYDGLYWAYWDDNWYASSWYDGPWAYVAPIYVPVFILRLPIRYYRHPPPAFRGWPIDQPPRWSLIWGHSWEVQRRGWDQWDRRNVPPRAPIPTYQKQYPRDRYPSVPTQQRQLEQQHYRYVPRDPRVNQYFENQRYMRSVPPRPSSERSAPGRAAPQQYAPQRPAQGQRPDSGGRKSKKQDEQNQD